MPSARLRLAFGRDEVATMCRCAPAARSMLSAGATLELRTDREDPVVVVGGYSTDPAGRLLLPVPADAPLARAADRHGEVPARATVTDVAPLPLRRRVRGRLSFTGWAKALEPSVAQPTRRDAACPCSPLAQEQRLVRVEPVSGPGA